jgi:hypothetical protein
MKKPKADFWFSSGKFWFREVKIEFFTPNTGFHGKLTPEK